MRSETVLALLMLLVGSLVTGCATTQDRRGSEQVCADPPPQAETPTPAAPIVPALPAAPTEADLRPRLLALGLSPRGQGHRGTCSIFTTCEAIEFAAAMDPAFSAGTRLSPEYLNWAAGQAAGRPSDGNFFHNALAGFEHHGVCTEQAMPYQAKFDAAAAPSDAARTEAARLRGEGADRGGPASFDRALDRAVAEREVRCRR